jgi:hypothetical protein
MVKQWGTCSQEPPKGLGTGHFTDPHSMKSTPFAAHRAPVARTSVMAHAWDDLALQRTWRSFGTLGVLLGLVNTVWAPVPGLALAALGAWGYAKGCPQCLQAVGLHRKR